tara:strand:+ start:6350 stop:7129 length:780 start_codon:yes stop_codon:yes gene_type:complete
VTEKHQPVVIKIGGNALGPNDTTFEDCVELQKRGIPIVIVHGGGPTITQWLDKQGVETMFVEGRRVTSEESLEIVTAVLCGLVNKKLVALINARGGRAVGISGVDATLVKADIRDSALGLVGEVESVDSSLIQHLLDGGYIPVVSPVSSNARAFEATLNVNADTVAAAVAGTLGAERLVFLTDVPGVLDEEGTPIGVLTPSQVRTLIGSEVISGGMIPKVEACIDALSYVGKAQIADGRETGVLRHALDDQAGSLIVGE